MKRLAIIALCIATLMACDRQNPTETENTETMETQKTNGGLKMKNTLFEECLANINPEIRAEVRKNMDATCRTCKHRQRWQADYETRARQYCGKRKSNRTSNGLLKIKVTNSACGYYEKED